MSSSNLLNNQSEIDDLNYYSWENRFSSFDKAISTAQKALKLARKIDYEKGQAYAKLNLAACCFLRSKNEEALPLLQEAKEFFDRFPEEKGYVNVLIHMGNIFESYGDYEKALDIAQRALLIAKETGYYEGEGDAQAVLGLIYTRLPDYRSAQNAYFESLKIREKSGSKNAIASSLNRLAQSFCLTGDYERALEYYSMSMDIRKEIGKFSGISWTYLGLASTYEYMKRFDDASKYYSMGTTNEETDIRCKAQCLTGSGRINRKQNNLEVAKKELLEAKLMAEKLNAKPLQYKIYLELAKYYEIEENTEKALVYYKKYHEIKEEVHNNESANRLKNQQIVFAIEKSEKEKEIFQLRNVELKSALDLIQEKNLEITDSIEYAKRIQSALLPKKNYLDEIVSDYFILFLPKDIVSGDFYWYSRVNDQTIVVAADCTGHGVPGAFMSMLGMSFLDDIVNKRKTTDPARIIFKLRKMIIKALKQKDSDVDSQDGMDIAICTFNEDEAKLTFAGAFNPLCMIRDNEVVCIPADRMPVSISLRSKDHYTNTVIDCKKGDRFYIYSDGFQDQFGFENNKKLKAAPFRNLLQETSGLGMAKQKQALSDFFDKWKGGSQQIDDVLVIGIEF